jgi:hypothetical protein
MMFCERVVSAACSLLLAFYLAKPMGMADVVLGHSDGRMQALNTSENTGNATCEIVARLRDSL